jgi:hypothetical protein
VRGIALVIDAANVILRHLAEIPDGMEARALRERALECIKEATEWKVARPTVETREAMMKRVLALHVAVKRLCEREDG